MTQTEYEQIMQQVKREPLPKRSDHEIAHLVEDLLRKMTIQDQLGQCFLTAFHGEFTYGPEFEAADVPTLVKDGMAGNLIGPYDNKVGYKMQEIAITQSPHKIPLLYANDIIHGCRIGFPINLAMSGSFDPALVERAVKVIAYETSHSGTNITFSPMLDIVRDPRWGRVVESPGEDPYLASVMAKAYVRGFQQNDLLSYDTVGTCIKHFVGYGAVEAGRDYNTVDMSERQLRNIYLPPFKAAIDEGAVALMSAFNIYDGVPITANKFLLRHLLRDEWKFDGVTISDYESTDEIINHKIAESREESAQICMKAGLDLEIISDSYVKYLKKHAEENNELKQAITDAARRVLTLKYRLGLFDNPFKNIYVNFEEKWLKEENLQVAEEMAEASIVLLKNEKILPLNNQKILFTGPFVDTNHVVGAWGGKVRNEDSVSLLDALQESNIAYSYVKGYALKEGKEDDLDALLEEAKASDVIVMTFGENQWDSGEASSKADVHLHPAQLRALKAVKTLNKPIISIVMSGRPLIINQVEELSDAVLYAWFLGTRSGTAIVNTLIGKCNPSARLPMTFPRHIGQIPLYYNAMQTGRPARDPNNYYTSKYLDVPNTPLYAFGYGLSYSSFDYSNFVLSTKELRKEQVLNVTLDITNTSKVAGHEIVQLYIEANSFSVSRPVKELKAFEKVWVEAEQTKTVTLHVSYDAFGYYNINNEFTPEQRTYHIMVGSSSDNILLTDKIQTR